MNSKLFLKIWASLISVLTLPNTDVTANVHKAFHENSSDMQLALKQSNGTDLFLNHAKDIYSGQMLFAGHRSHRSHSSHRSHRSHYSSRTYAPSPSSPSTDSSAPSVSGKKYNVGDGTYAPSPSSPSTDSSAPSVSDKKYNIGDVKMVQIALNMLGYNGFKIDGLENNSVKTALKKYKKTHELSADGNIDSQICLSLATLIKEKFPEDENAQKIYNHLILLYLKLVIE
ncbi:MAG: peptidoglycan-binding protein [Chloroflexi bacterium]|nr:peptidoglycan-binding protein [Chloroflexota bacterium]